MWRWVGLRWREARDFLDRFSLRQLWGLWVLAVLLLLWLLLDPRG